MEFERKYVVESQRDPEAEKVAFAVEHMHTNKAYLSAVEKSGGTDADGQILKQFQDAYRKYRHDWRANPRFAIANKLSHDFFAKTGNPPLCVDIEVAAYCDLACPFCFRQTIATPDKMIDKNTAFRLIDEATELGVPSMKFNWRGEPLAHPGFTDIVAYAKRSGVLETIINTNATYLTEEKSDQIIDAGLDLLIYSFDGGSKESYEKMRPGRFKKNRFEDVYNNIKKFAEVKKRRGAAWPRTKIQMILTEETFQEVDQFYELFTPYVDDVSVKAYTERGGKIDDLDAESKAKVKEFLEKNNLPEDTAYWRSKSGDIHVSAGRLPCEQIFQRLMITYDGRVSMCCYDWGSKYPIGYADKTAFEKGDDDFKSVMKSASDGKKGFEYMKNLKMPERYINPKEEVHTLKEIWDGKIVNGVRKMHIKGDVDKLEVCRKCAFKETYNWKQIN